MKAIMTRTSRMKRENRQSVVIQVSRASKGDIRYPSIISKLIIVTAISALPALSSCARHDPSGQVGGTPQAQTNVPPPPALEPGASSPWALRFSSTCGETISSPESAAGSAAGAARLEPAADRAVRLQSCAGAYGFEVNQEGKYRIGPGPSGQVVEGFLSQADFDELRNVRGQAAGSAAAAPLRECDPDQKGHCDPLLSEKLKDLAQRYSPQTFPNPCVDADAGLRQLYEAASSCESDSDCQYVGDDFLPLDSDRKEVHEAIADDCSFASALPVANEFKLVQLQRELLLKRESVRQVCGKSRKTNCEAPRSFDPWKSSYACVEGKCRVSSTHYNPSAN